MSVQLAKFIRANVEMNLATVGNPTVGFDYFKFNNPTDIAKKREKLQKILTELDDPEFAYRKYYACLYYAGSINLDKMETKLVSHDKLTSMTDVELVELIINNWVPYRVKRVTIIHLPITPEFEKLIRKLKANTNYLIDVTSYSDCYEVEIVRRERMRVNVAEHEALTVFNRFYLAKLFNTSSVTIASFLPWKEYLTKLGYKTSDNEILTVDI